MKRLQKTSGEQRKESIQDRLQFPNQPKQRRPLPKAMK